ncbi:MAG TPA: amidohydrolase family protein [Kamptonema sp.]|nr:amidohydrolase family protein [Kamptonema sp.]
MSDRVKTLPSDYFRRQCFIDVEPTEPSLGQTIDRIGSNNLIFGSDYPHMDRQLDIVEKTIALENSLSKETVQKIIWDNPRRFYGLH